MQGIKISALVFIMAFSYSQEPYDGLLLFSPTGSGGGGGGTSFSYLMDIELHIVHSWTHSNGAASMPYLLPDSSLIFPYRVTNPALTSGGVGGGIMHVGWNGEVFWNHVIANTSFQHHHDVEPLPNGNVLVIVWENKSAAEAYSMGRQTINNPLNQMWSEALFELQPDGNGGVDIVWEWHLWDHLIQNVNPALSNYAVISDTPEQLDINLGNVGSSGGPGGPNADWMHINAVSYHSELDQIVISSRFRDEIYILDHSTTTEEAAGHSGGNYNKGGDFLYRWGNPQNYDRGTSSDHILDDQHGVNWIPEEFPGEGRLILFNNGHSGNNSAVLELETPILEDGSYNIADGEPYGPDSWSWIHMGGFQTDVQGGAFRMPNGNTLITEADDGRIFEVTADGNTVWEYEHPGSQVMIARANKFDPEYLAPGFVTLMGDINDDGMVNVQDVIFMVNFILGSDEPDDYESLAGDMNGDLLININDIVLLVSVILGE